MSYSWAFAKWKGLVSRFKYKKDEFWAGRRHLTKEPMEGNETRKTVKKATKRRNRRKNKRIAEYEKDLYLTDKDEY